MPAPILIGQHVLTDREARTLRDCVRTAIAWEQALREGTAPDDPELIASTRRERRQREILRRLKGQAA